MDVADAASPSEPQSGQGEHGHRTVSSEPPKRPAGRTKFHETRHPLYRGVRERGRRGQWVCEVRVLGMKHSTPPCSRSPPALTLPTPRGGCCPCSRPSRSASAARARSRTQFPVAVAVEVLQQQQVPVAVAVVALQQQQIPVAVAVEALQQQQRPVAVAVVALQKQQIPVACPAAEASGALFYMSSGDLLKLDDEQWFRGMDAESYCASLAQGMLMAPPDDDRARQEDGEQSGVETPLWSYLFDRK